MSAEPPQVRLPADDHVHSQFSYDTGADASMRHACERAVALGLPSIAFTEHVELIEPAAGDALATAGVTIGYGDRTRSLDVEAYLASVDECRARYPSLRVLSGVEAGQPHLFAGSLAGLLAGGRFDRVLGSCHALVHEGALVEVSTLYRLMPAEDAVRRYFAEVLAVVEGSGAFQVLAHVDFIGRYLPKAHGRYDDADYEEEYRTVFRALARSGRALELNTKSRLASVAQLRWWYEAGGTAVSFGSDAHVPWVVGDGFATAVAMTEAAGFRPGRHPYDWWRR
ncbi:MAG: histidinol-phosphatase family [Frankiales bacterium]|jgi:histidinol-phosphatase (PHP family)|nr:histidinol-phosphatase family [Frankiales bacterium]MDX6210258.1 histidinol-phosphatase family [Frankiales bacterium]